MKLRFVTGISVLASITWGAQVSPSEREMVLSEGETITVYPLPHNQVLHPEAGDIPFKGALTIRAGKGFIRYYTCDGETRWVELWPRDHRWRNGSFGAYYPGVGSHWRSNHGITRGTLEEGLMHFDTLEQAQDWLASKPYAVYNNEGLVVDFSKTSSGGGTLAVAVWQILIQGQHPTVLKNSHENLIRVTK